MKPHLRIRSLARTAALLAALALLPSCTGTAEAVRSLTYPPDFDYVPKGEVDSVMWSLAHQVNELDRLMRQPGELDADTRAQAVALLASMESEARSIDPEGRASNHPLLSAHVDGFVERLAAARQALERDPPSRFLAGAVSGSCLSCHDKRVANRGSAPR